MLKNAVQGSMVWWSCVCPINLFKSSLKKIWVVQLSWYHNGKRLIKWKKVLKRKPTWKEFCKIFHYYFLEFFVIFFNFTAYLISEKTFVNQIEDLWCNQQAKNNKTCVKVSKSQQIIWQFFNNSRLVRVENVMWFNWPKMQWLYRPIYTQYF